MYARRVRKVIRTAQDVRAELRALEERDALEAIERRRRDAGRLEQERTRDSLRRFGMIVR